MFFAMMMTIGDLIYLNLLMLLCSLPIVTAGASFTAMHSVLRNMVRNEERYTTREFFRSFKRNFWRATAAWCIFLAMMSVLVVDIMLAWSAGGAARRAAVPLLLVVIGIFCACAQFYFPLLSCCDLNVVALLRKCARLSFGFLPRTLAMLGLTLACLICYAQFLGVVFPLLLLLGISLPQYCCALLIEQVLRRIDHDHSIR